MSVVTLSAVPFSTAPFPTTPTSTTLYNATPFWTWHPMPDLPDKDICEQFSKITLIESAHPPFIPEKPAGASVLAELPLSPIALPPHIVYVGALQLMMGYSAALDLQASRRGPWNGADAAVETSDCDGSFTSSASSSDNVVKTTIEYVCPRQKFFKTMDACCRHVSSLFCAVDMSLLCSVLTLDGTDLPDV